MIKCLGIFHKKTPSRKKFRRNSVIKADSLSELKIAVDHQSKLCSSRLADTVFFRNRPKRGDHLRAFDTNDRTFSLLHENVENGERW